MAVRETLTVRPPRHRKRVRAFAVAWTGITLLVGAVTFIAIYAATGIVANGRGLAPAGITVNTVNTDNNAANAAINSANVAAASSDTGAANGNSNANPNGQAAAVALQVTATTGGGGAPATNTENANSPTLVPSPGGSGASGATPTLVGAAGAAVISATATSAPVASGTVPAIKDVDFDLGVAVQEDASTNTFHTWTAMANEQLRVNWVKMQVVWSQLEQTKGKIDFSTMDVDLPMLNKAGLKVMLSVAKAPVWARDPGAKTKADANGDLHDGPPADPADFANFVTAILKRYPGMVNAIEVFNEVNLDREWTTAPQKLDPARYVKLLQVAHDAIKAVDPNIVVISSALSPTGANIAGRAQDDFVYMQLLINAGMLKYADCVGAHHNGINVPPNAEYNNIPEHNPPAKYRGPWDNPNHSWAFKTTLEGYENLIKKANSTLKLCVTEFGWPTAQGLPTKASAGFSFANDNTPADQANWTDQAITEMQTWGYVRLAFLWNLNYGAEIGWDASKSDNVLWSILGPAFQPRPVWQKIVDRNFKGQPRKATQ